MIFPRIVTILVDSREKKPLPLPKTVMWSEVGGHPFTIQVQVQTTTLAAGDYQLARGLCSCIVERKGSLNEIQQNLQTKDRRRAMAAFRKLVDSTPHPVLALDFPITQRLYRGEESETWTRLMQLCATFNLQIITCGGGSRARKKLGELVVRLLLAYRFDSGAPDAPIHKEPSRCQQSFQQLSVPPRMPSNPNADPDLSST